MWQKIIDYIKRHKLLSILLGIYIILLVTSGIYLYNLSEKSGSSGSIFQRIFNPNKQNTAQTTPASTPMPTATNNQNDNSETSNDNGGTSGESDSEPQDVDPSYGEAYVVFYADTQSDTDEEDSYHQSAVNNILATGANPVFHLGDIMEDGTQNSIDRFLAVTSVLRGSRTFYPALGNNDRVVGDSSTPSPFYFDNFGVPRYYSVNVGGLHMIVLDSAFSSLAPGSAQYNWLVSDLQSDEARTRVVGIMLHHPSSLSSISSLINDYHVDFTVAGHVHSYSQSYGSGAYNFTSSGQTSIGYIIVSVSGNNINVRAYDSGNGQIDSASFTNR